jgi:hypothetical protein
MPLGLISFQSTMPKNDIHDLDIFATKLSFNHVVIYLIMQLDHVYNYMTKSCHEAHNYMIKANGLISKPCLTK